MSSRREGRRSFLRMGGAAALALSIGDIPATLGAGRTIADDEIVTIPAMTVENISELSADAADERAWTSLRSLFPLRADRIYLNSGGFGPASYPVLQARQRAEVEVAEAGEEQRKRMKSARERIAAFLGCDEDELAFTAGTTSAMNLIANGLVLKADDEIVMSTHEHPGGAMIWVKRAQDIGCRIRLFEPGDSAEATLNAVQALLTPRTRLVMTSHVTCTTGYRMPVRAIAALCRTHGCLSVVDGAHPPGMIPVNLRDLGCDFYAASGHKWLFGPTGTGMLFVRRDLLDVWSTPLAGAYADDSYSLEESRFVAQKKARAVEVGTYNSAAYEALGAAVELAENIGIDNIARRGIFLANFLKQELLQIAGLKLLTPLNESDSASIVTFQVLNDAVDPRDLLRVLSERDGLRLRFVSEHGLNAIRIAPMYCTSTADLQVLIDALRREVR